MKSIVIIVNKYPNSVEPNVCVFIQQLVWSLADMGYECSVICPMPVNFNKKYLSFPEMRAELNENGKEIKIYHPKYFSLGQSGKIAQKLRVSITTKLFECAVESVIKKIEKPDVLYSHFLCPAGVATARIGKKYGIHAYMAHGESMYSGDEKYGNKKLKRDLASLDGVVAVSSQNKDYLVEANVIDAKKVRVFPNGYRKERFEKKDKIDARKKFGFPKDEFIVGFCGSFDERKGVLRLQEAVNQVSGVLFACAGKGQLKPTSNKCLWAQPVNNDELAYFYSALDAFVLPTQHEGCCNAIVEAIACGCPIVSANRSFNIDICDKTNSILVNPDSIDEIKDAIIKLRDSEELREKLSVGSLRKAENLTLKQRAANIAEFMNLR